MKLLTDVGRFPRCWYHSWNLSWWDYQACVIVSRLALSFLFRKTRHNEFSQARSSFYYLFTRQEVRYNIHRGSNIRRKPSYIAPSLQFIQGHQYPIRQKLEKTFSITRHYIISMDSADFKYLPRWSQGFKEERKTPVKIFTSRPHKNVGTTGFRAVSPFGSV